MYSVLLIDMSHYADPDSEQLIGRFESLRKAREFARRRVRDSLEGLRAESESEEHLRQRWFLYGVDALVLNGDYAGSRELDRFLNDPATPEERDWQSLLPNLPHP